MASVGSIKMTLDVSGSSAGPASRVMFTESKTSSLQSCSLVMLVAQSSSCIMNADWKVSSTWALIIAFPLITMLWTQSLTSPLDRRWKRLSTFSLFDRGPPPLFPSPSSSSSSSFYSTRGSPTLVMVVTRSHPFFISLLLALLLIANGASKPIKFENLVVTSLWSPLALLPDDEFLTWIVDSQNLTDEMDLSLADGGIGSSSLHVQLTHKDSILATNATP